MNIHRLYIALTLLAVSTVSKAQFIDLEWNATDSVPPSYTHSYDLGYDYLDKECRFVMEYTEYQIATEEEIKRYGVDVEALSDSFPVSLRKTVSKKRGSLEVAVYPFSKKGEDVVKLLSLKPVVTMLRQSTPPLRMENAASRYADHSVLATGKWAKIHVDESGVYQLTPQFLSSAGFSNPSKVKVYGYGGEVISEGEIDNMQDDLNEVATFRKSDGTILFYARGTVSWKWNSKTRANITFTHRNNTYSQHSYYFITENDSTAPMTIQAEEAPEAEVFHATTFVEHATIDNDAFSFLNSGRRFFDSYDFVNGNTHTYDLSLPGIVPNSKSTVSVSFAASSSMYSSTLSFAANDSTLGTLLFSANGQYDNAKVMTRSFTNVLLKENTRFKLEHNRNTGVNGRLDYIDVNYTRQLALSGKSMNFRFVNTGTTSNSVTFDLSGSNSDTQVWRVTSPAAITKVNTTSNGSTMTGSVTCQPNVNEFIAVNTSTEYPTPTLDGEVENQDLHALRDINFVIIVPTSGKLKEQAQRLADAHLTYDSITSVVITADKIYNEFSSGTPDATAYRRLMKMLYDRATDDSKAPQSLLLFGSGFWDNRMINSTLKGFNPDDYLLCYESDLSTSKTDSYVSEDYFGMLDDGEGVSILKDKMDIGVGRLPFDNAADAKQMVDKLIAYMTNQYAGPWKNTICMMGDDGDNNVHMNDTKAVCNTIETNNPDYHLKKIFWGAYPQEVSSTGKSFPAVTADIYKQISDGALIFNYTGHAAAYTLSHEQVLKLSDFASFSTNKNPLWFTAGCDITPFDQNEETVGVTSLLNKRGGSIGWVTTARTVYSSQNQKINKAFMTHILSHPDGYTPISVGEALRRAKGDIVSSISTARDSINNAHYILLGDPALRILTPYYKTVVDSFNGKEVKNANDTIKAGSVVRVSGHVEDQNGKVAEGFNGKLSASVYDNIETITCTIYDSDTETPFSYTDRTKTIYSGADSVRNGRFEFSFPVPVDINYSNESGRIDIYAINDSNSVEAQGKFEEFKVGGTYHLASNDTIGPDIRLYLNSEDFKEGDMVNETPVLIAYLHDDSGINTTGSGIGHDIMAIVDNKEALTMSLNSYYVSDIGDYTSGKISYLMPAMEVGDHSLLFRAWDVMNNPSVKEVHFTVEEGLQPAIFNFTVKGLVRTNAIFQLTTDRMQSALNITIDVFDVTGRKVWTKSDISESETNIYNVGWNLQSADGSVPPGVYVARASVAYGNGSHANKAVKFVVVGNKKGH
ncbi:MAG: type IX secretion system sortase PorU [Bacteroidaceae bacterium]|nr:type IX secretion system sortase PorU [Bacteroidaceae bacterium]